MLRSLFLSATVLTASAHQFVFSEMPGAIPGNYSFWSFDSNSKEVKLISQGYESVQSAWDFVSGAAVCGAGDSQRYYASATDFPVMAGIQVVDMTTGKNTVINYSSFGQLIPHTIYCDPTDPTGQTLYIVESTVGPGSTGFPTYTLFKVKIDEDFQLTQRQLGVFPSSKTAVSSGFDCEFQVTPDYKYLYATWSTKGNQGGTVHRMELATGNLVGTYKLVSFNAGHPYGSLIDSKGNYKIVMYAFASGGGPDIMHRCDLTFDDKKKEAKASNCQQDQSLFVGGMPWTPVLEDGNAYVIRYTTSQLYVIGKNGTIVESIDIPSLLPKSQNGKYGGLAVYLGGKFQSVKTVAPQAAQV